MKGMEATHPVSASPSSPRFGFFATPAIPKIVAELMQFSCENSCKMLQAEAGCRPNPSSLKKWIKNLWAGGQRIMLPLLGVIRQHSTLTHAAVARERALVVRAPRATITGDVRASQKPIRVVERWRPMGDDGDGGVACMASAMSGHFVPTMPPPPIPSQEINQRHGWQPIEN